MSTSCRDVTWRDSIARSSSSIDFSTGSNVVAAAVLGRVWPRVVALAIAQAAITSGISVRVKWDGISEPPISGGRSLYRLDGLQAGTPYQGVGKAPKRKTRRTNGG